MKRTLLIIVCFSMCAAHIVRADTNRFPLAGTPVFINNPDPVISGSFGESAARFDSDRFLVGGSSRGGAAFLFGNDGSLLLSIPNPNVLANGGFGSQVAPFDKDRILIGDDTAKRVYLFDTNGQSLAVFTDPTPVVGLPQQFGSSMCALGFDRVAIGDASDAAGKGVVYIFDTNATLVVAVTNTIPDQSVHPESAAFRWGGSLVSAGPGQALVGTDVNILNPPHAASLIDRDGNIIATFWNPIPTGQSQFGRSTLRLTQDLVLITDPSLNNVSVEEGGGYLFHTNGSLVQTYKSRTSLAQAGATAAGLGPENFALGGSGEYDFDMVALFHVSGGEPAELMPSSTNEAGFGSSVAGVGTNMLLVGVKDFDNNKGLVKLYPLSFTFPDIHEPDDFPQFATPFRIGTNQTHTLHRPGDEDWVSFFALSNLTFTVMANNVSTNLDIAIDIFRREINGRLTPVVLAQQEGGAGVMERITLTNLVTGMHLVRYYAASDPFGGQFPKTQPRTVTTEYGDDAEYDIVILGPTPTVLLVIVVDMLSEGAANAPPDAMITVDGNAPVLVSESTLWVNGLSAGVHTVSVAVAEGYLSEEDPADPNQVDNPDNVLFGNPRHVDVLGSGMSFAAFTYLPIAAVDANVRDSLTGGPAERVGLSFVATDGILDGLTNSVYPFGAAYAEPWVTPTVGTFPTNVLIPATNWVLHLSGAGYVSRVVSNGLSGLGPDDDIDLGDIFIVPVDLNSNGISDAWETLHFGGSISGQGDSDMDGLTEQEEYLVGTDPTNATSRFAFDPAGAPGSDGLLTFCWPVAQGRTYTLSTIDDLNTTNWALGVGPWVAPSNGTFCWTDAASTTAVSRTYRVDVILP